MWLKKKANISGYNSNTAYNGTDWRTTGSGGNWSVSETLPSAADAGNYFYLPALGSYYSGKLKNIGILGYYLSSSAYPGGTNGAYSVTFGRGFIRMYNYARIEAGRVEPSFE